jgi:signal transduction histidine kinase
LLPVIKANPLQMQQLFSNLISNSLKFSGDDPSIEISARRATGAEINGEDNIDRTGILSSFVFRQRDWF